jgi:hypothetical protein
VTLVALVGVGASRFAALGFSRFGAPSPWSRRPVGDALSCWGETIPDGRTRPVFGSASTGCAPEAGRSLRGDYGRGPLQSAPDERICFRFLRFLFRCSGVCALLPAGAGVLLSLVEMRRKLSARGHRLPRACRGVCRPCEASVVTRPLPSSGTPASLSRRYLQRQSGREGTLSNPYPLTSPRTFITHGDWPGGRRTFCSRSKRSDGL